MTDSSRPQKLIMYSQKSPEEARIFGFRGADIRDIWEPVEEEAPVSPDDWGFTSTSEDGICKYCQLLLHPDAPGVIAHQPTISALIASECRICGWVEVSIVRGAPELAEGFQRGDPAICDENSTSCAVTIALVKMPKFTRAIASVGARNSFAPQGVPLNLTTRIRLGNLFSRVFWQPEDSRDEEPSPRRLAILKTWLDECRENHDNCSSGFDKNPLPTRVLDLTGSPDVPSTPDDIKIKLRDVSAGETGQYAALSYCWGADPEHHFKTTQQNLDQHRDGISFSNIPLTQREAILSALFLGIRYVWIDSLCIIQDSPTDWEREAARMSVVYSNAVVTLAATYSPSPAHGLLNPLQSALSVDMHGDLAIVRMETHTTIDTPSEPLNNRAWTLQEAVLSPRMVSFGSEQWLWKCFSRTATEDGLLDRPPNVGDGPSYSSTRAQQDSDSGGHGHLTHWYRLVANYSRRALTLQEDKLKAIAGLADIFAKQTEYQYVAGLWAEDIAKGLLWQATSHGVTSVPGTTPSWSWASVNGAILMQEFSSSSTIMMSLVKVEQEWQGEPMTSPLKVAHLHVRGPMIKLSLGEQSRTQRLRYALVRHPTSEEIFGEAFLDNLDPIEEGVTEVYCLHVYANAKGSSGEREHFTLILLPVQDKGHRFEVEGYRRIGLGIIWEMSKFADGREAAQTSDGLLATNMLLV